MIRTLKDVIDGTLAGSHDRLRLVSGTIADVAALMSVSSTEPRMRMVRTRNGPALISCPGCGVHVEMDMIVDVSAAPVELTGGARWACTGCLDLWYRQRRMIGEKVVTRADVHRAVGGGLVDDAHVYWSVEAVDARQR